MITNQNFIHRLDISSSFRLQTTLSNLKSAAKLDYHYRYIVGVDILSITKKFYLALIFCTKETIVCFGRVFTITVCSYGDQVLTMDLMLFL